MIVPAKLCAVYHQSMYMSLNMYLIAAGTSMLASTKDRHEHHAHARICGTRFWHWHMGPADVVDQLCLQSQQ